MCYNIPPRSLLQISAILPIDITLSNMKFLTPTLLCKVQGVYTDIKSIFIVFLTGDWSTVV
jgi:hypothetical protein